MKIATVPTTLAELRWWLDAYIVKFGLGCTARRLGLTIDELANVRDDDPGDISPPRLRRLLQEAAALASEYGRR